MRTAKVKMNTKAIAQYSVGKDSPKKAPKKEEVSYPYNFLQDMRKAEIKERNPDTGNEVLITSLDPYTNKKHKELVDKWYGKWKEQKEKKGESVDGGGSSGKKKRTVKKRTTALSGKSLGTATTFAANATSRALGFEDAKDYEKASKEAKNLLSAKDLTEAFKGEGKQWVQFAGFLAKTGLNAAKAIAKKKKKVVKSKKPSSAKKILDEKQEKFKRQRAQVEEKRAALNTISDVLMKYTDVAVGVAATTAFGPLGGVVGAFVTNAVGRYAKDKVRKIDELMGVNCSEITDLQKKNCFKKAGLKSKDEELEAEILALTMKLYLAYGEAVKQAFDDLKKLTPEQIKELEDTKQFEDIAKKMMKKGSEEKEGSDFFAEVMTAFEEACLEDEF